MEIKKLLKDLGVFIKKHRGSGATTLLEEIASENDVNVLTKGREEGELFKGKAIDLHGIYGSTGK